MALQSQVYTNLPPAIPGQVMTADDAHFSPVAYTADTDIVVGAFVMLKTGNVKRVVQAGTTAIAGLVARAHQGMMQGFTAANKILAGQPVTPILRGNVAVVNGTNTTVTVGMNVFASQADGSCVFSNNATESSCTATPWKVVQVFGTGAKNDIVVISTYGNNAGIPVVPTDLTGYLTKAVADTLYEPKTP